ncbi:MAG: permease of phosphate ABC transporter [Clostridiales bacterium]
MRRYLQCADRYIKKMGVCDIALLKGCMMSLGMLAGLSVALPFRRKARNCATLLFVMTYVPLMTGFFHHIREDVAVKKRVEEQE